MSRLRSPAHSSPPCSNIPRSKTLVTFISSHSSIPSQKLASSYTLNLPGLTPSRSSLHKANTSGFTLMSPSLCLQFSVRSRDSTQRQTRECLKCPMVSGFLWHPKQFVSTASSKKKRKNIWHLRWGLPRPVITRKGLEDGRKALGWKLRPWAWCLHLRQLSQPQQQL